MTITGSGFGTAQGNGQVWLGTANGSVITWNNTQIVAAVAAGAASGSVRVLQAGILSNAVPFSVSALHITSASPVAGTPGTTVTLTGTGFGATQSSSVVWLGSLPGVVASWSDTQIMAAVAPGSVNGIVRVQKDGKFSNVFEFTVPGSGDFVRLLPAALTMAVDDTATLQAINSAGQVVSGLTWTTSDSGIVSLSSADPPVLTAVAAGEATITAGGASAHVTVLPAGGDLPLGTILWTVPGKVDKLVPAVPSTSGVADVFAFQANEYGDLVSAQAITSEGTVAWTVDVSWARETPLPDFLGGLVYPEGNSDGSTSIVRVDGITGQKIAVHTASAQDMIGFVTPHPDGTIFAAHDIWNGDGWDGAVIGINPGGGVKFRVPVVMNAPPGYFTTGEKLIVAGDGYAYLPYHWNGTAGEKGSCHIGHLRLLRVNSQGAFNDMKLLDWGDGYESCQDLPNNFNADIITNADQGVVVTWQAFGRNTTSGTAVVSGTSVSVNIGTGLPGQAYPLEPAIQLEDGTFVGSGGFYAGEDIANALVGFDQTGAVRWMIPGNYQAQVATTGGGLIANQVDDWGNVLATITVNQYGGITGQLPDAGTYSWSGHLYHQGSIFNAIPGLLGMGVTWKPLASVGAYFPHDWKANARAAQILSQRRWRVFGRSTCGSVAQTAIGATMPSYSLTMVENKGKVTNYYDLGNPGVGSLTLLDVTGGQYGTGATLSQYIQDANAATVNMGYNRNSAVILKAGILDGLYPQFTLVHEILLHAYSSWWDDAVFSNSVFQQNGLWRPSGSAATLTVSTWMGTDCRCTPGRPGTPCQSNTAGW